MGKISVIICTLNRAESLGQTLASLAGVRRVEGCTHELVVVDNGSTDGTARVLETATMPPGWDYRVVRETQKGLSRARNKGVSTARGDILIFTDDDIRFPNGWLHSMTGALLKKEAHALAGHVRLAPELNRPWMDDMHHVWLASTRTMDFKNIRWLVGANMSITRGVFEKIPVFDEELGAGAMGFAEETLFAWQMLEAGFRIHEAVGEPVIHHPDLRRFTRKDLLASAKKRGHSTAYLAHHWNHETLPNPTLKAWEIRSKLLIRRFLQPPGKMESEGAPSWELSYFSQFWLQKAYMEEVRVGRKYEKKALRKKTLAETADNSRDRSLRAVR